MAESKTQGLYHYVQFWNDSTSGAITISRYAGGSSYPELAGHSYTPPMQTGAWAMQVDVSAPNHTMAMTGRYAGAPFAALSSAAPQLVAGNDIDIYANNISLTFDYFLVIETLP